jgi:imidazolonepropionase-like amidohydrolase
MRNLLFLLGAGCATASSSPAPESAGPTTTMAVRPADIPRNTKPLLLRGATVWTATGRTFAPGEVLVVDGKIAEVGEHVSVPPGAEVLDLPGKHVTPGIIDTHSHLGVYPAPFIEAVSDGNEASAPVTAEVEAAHGFWPLDPGIPRALAGGVTAMQILPGSANLIGGRGFTVKLRPGRSARAMRFPGAPDGLKMACGENPKRVYGQERHMAPMTRMGSVAGYRAAFQRAREYRDRTDLYRRQLEAWEKKGGEAKDRPVPPERNLALDTLAAVLDGRILVHVHCYRADEMLLMLEIADEFGFRVRSFHHAVEAYKIRDILARRGVAASTWADWWGFKLEAFDGIPENAALLAAAGGRTIIHSDSGIGIQRLNQEAGKAYYKGRAMGLALTEDDALRWVTANPAWALGVDAMTGTVEKGKMADLVVWSGHPFSVYSHAEKVFIDGVLSYDLSARPAIPSDFETGLGEVGP